MAQDMWRMLKPDDVNMRSVTSFDPLYESFVPGAYMTSLGHEVHDIGFALRYRRDPTTTTPLELQMPAVVQIAPMGNGMAQTLVNGEYGTTVFSPPYPFPDEGWVFGQWSPQSQQWNLQISHHLGDPGIPILFDSIPASTYDPVSISDRLTLHGSAGPRITSMTFGPWPSVLRDAEMHVDGSRQQHIPTFGRSLQKFEAQRDEVFGFSMQHNGPGVLARSIPYLPLKERSGPNFY